MRSGAVFNERDIARTLHVLRYELSKAYADMEKSQAGFEARKLQQHEALIKLVKDCDELSLMLYSQKQDFTFDLTYALQQVTDQYHHFTDTKVPFDNILNYFDVEIDRYDRLIKALKIIPPEMMEVADSVVPSLLGALAMTLHITAFADISLPSMNGTVNGDGLDQPLFDFQLDTTAQMDRDSCIFYASRLLDMFTDIRKNMVQDKEYYDKTDNRLSEAYHYAQERYKQVQKRIFVDGHGAYWTVLPHLRQYSFRAIGDFKDKYSKDFHGTTVKSEWRGPIVIAFSFIILVYLALASLLSWLITKGLKKKVGFFRSEGFASRERGFIILASIFLFVILVGLARLSPRIGNHFFMMASSLLLEYSLLLAALLISLLIRLSGEQIDRGVRAYIPVMALGLLVIAFRIIFIPNSLIILIFPPLLLLFLLWQWGSMVKNAPYLSKADNTLIGVSLFVTTVTLIMSLVGYSLMGLQVYIWWIFQLAVLQLILAIKRIVGLYRSKSVTKRVKAYRMKHPYEIGNAKGDSFLVTWLYDLLDMVVIPLAILASIPCCLLLASRVFDLTEIFHRALFYPFLDVKAITLSLYKVLIVVGLFFVFRYIEYAACSLYRVLKIRDVVSKSGSRLLRDNEVNLTLANNVIWLLTWGFFVIAAIGILKIPTNSLKVIAAGLAAGLGFAMKDILNNFFYGVQLMSGRLRVGDTIECDGIRGTVDNISYQTTTIKAIEGSLIAFPNSTLFSKTFKNLTKSDSYEYIALPVGVAYGTDVDKARRVILRAMRPLCKPDKFGRDIVKPSYGIQVTIKGFGDSSVDLNVKQYVLVDQRYNFVARANEIIYKALADNGIQIPFPQVDVHMKSDSETE